VSTVSISVLSSIATFVLTIVSELVIISFNAGRTKERINMLEAVVQQKADHGDIVQIKEALAEIKGMFVLKLRE